MDNRQSIMAILAFIVLLCTLLTHQYASRRYETLTKMRIKADTHKEILDLTRQCLTDAETGYRGYLLAEDQFYRTTYDKAISRFPKLIEKFEQLYETRNVKKIIELMQKRMDNLTQGVNLFSTGMKQEAIELLKNNEGKRLMDLCRDELDVLRLEILNEEASKESEFQITAYWLSSGLGILHLVAIVLIALAMIPKSELKFDSLKE